MIQYHTFDGIPLLLLLLLLVLLLLLLIPLLLLLGPLDEVNPGAIRGSEPQQHQEFVIFDHGQAYPDYIIHFHTPTMRDPVMLPLAASVGLGPNSSRISL